MVPDLFFEIISPVPLVLEPKRQKNADDNGCAFGENSRPGNISHSFHVRSQESVHSVCADLSDYPATGFRQGVKRSATGNYSNSFG